MQGKNHVGLALAVPLALALAGIPEAIPGTFWGWGALIVGSLAPDIDGGGAIARPSKFIPDIIPKWLQRAIDKIGLKISKVIRAIFGHRGGLHWPLWAGLMIWAGMRYDLNLLLWLGVGYGLHILGDIITVAGVPLLGPLTSKKFSVFPMRVGGRLESVLAVVIWLFVVIRGGFIGLAGAGAIDQGLAMVERLKYLLAVQ